MKKTSNNSTEIAPGVIIYDEEKVLFFNTQISGEKVILRYDLGRDEYTRNECSEKEPGLLCRVAEYNKDAGEFKYAFSLAGLKNISSYETGRETAIITSYGICWFVSVMNAWAACPKFCETIKGIANLEKEKNSDIKIAQCMDEMFSITKTPFIKNQKQEYLNKCKSTYIKLAQNLWAFSIMRAELLRRQIKELEEGNCEKGMIETLKTEEKICHSARVTSETLITCRGLNERWTVFSIVTALKNHHYNLVGNKSPEEVWGDVTLSTTSACYPGYIFYELSNKIYNNKEISRSIGLILQILALSPGLSVKCQPVQDEVQIQYSPAPQILHIIREKENIPSNTQRYFFERQYTLRSALLASMDHVSTRIKSEW